MHHYHEMDALLAAYQEDLKACEEIMVKNYMDKFYHSNFCTETPIWMSNEKYVMSEEAYKRDSEKVKEVFNKPYPETFEENVGILKRFLKFLCIRDIKVLVYIPPFAYIFNEFTDKEMKKATWDVLRELNEIYEFDILDLSDSPSFVDEYFADWCHLNRNGAELATELLNEYMRKIWGGDGIIYLSSYFIVSRFALRKSIYTLYHNCL